MVDNAYNKVLAAEQVEQAASWDLPLVDGPRATRQSRPSLAELDAVERMAWEEGHAKGHAAGLAVADKEHKKRMEELNKQVKHLEEMVQLLSTPMAALDDQMEQLMVTLSLGIAKHLIRRELRIDPTQVIAIVRETVAQLPLSQRNVRVYMHPLDAAVVRERLSEPQSERAWSIIEDPVMGRGGCRVSTDTTQIDARLESRVAAVFNQLLGDDRLLEERSDTAADDEGATP